MTVPSQPSGADVPAPLQPAPDQPYPDQPEREQPELDQLVGEWLTLPAIAELLHLPITAVRRMLDEREFLAVRRGERHVLSVPAKFLTSEGPLTHLRGTLTVLTDARVDDDEAMRWLFTPDDTLTGGSPIDALVAGQKTEIRRRASELAL